MNECFAQSENEFFYAFKEDWTPAPSIDKCTYFMHGIKKSDSEYVCRYYNKTGPMIRQECYKDSSLSIPNGFFCWYNDKGKIDSCGWVSNFKKDGTWRYFMGDSTNETYHEEYDNGQFLKRDAYHPVDSLNLPKDSTEKEATFGDDKSAWNKYMVSHIKTPDRFTQIVKPGKYVVTVAFVVNKKGGVEQVMLLKSVEWSADEEVFSIIENSPAWKPAIQNGKPVLYRQKQNITFTVTY